MKKKWMKSFVIAFVCSLGLATATACDVAFQNADEAQNEHLIPESYDSQVDAENDENMLIDGKLIESVYGNANWFEFSYASNVDGKKPTVYLTGFTTEYGVYIASKANDTNVRYGGGFMEQIAPANSTGWELTIVVDKDGENPSLYRNNWFVYMLDCKGNAKSTKRATPSSRRLTA